jgi:formate/nitrite transporter FocA (FNT family)
LLAPVEVRGRSFAHQRGMTNDHQPAEPEDASRTAADQEEHEAEERSAPAGSVVYRAISSEGEEELSRASVGLMWSGLAAGLSMGFSLMTEGLLRAHLPDTQWRLLVAKLGYSVGFVVVVLGRQQLFTENTLTVVLPLMRHGDRHTLANVARLWTIVLAANLAGALAFAFVAARTSVFAPEVVGAFRDIGHRAIEPGFLTLLIRGIFAGWLIALMVWLMPAAESARLWVIILIAYVVGIGEFSHVIAGSTEVLLLVALGEQSFLHYLGSYLVPTLAGNVIGGVSLVAAFAHGQFVSSEEV